MGVVGAGTGFVADGCVTGITMGLVARRVVVVDIVVEGSGGWTVVARVVQSEGHGTVASVTIGLFQD